MKKKKVSKLFSNQLIELQVNRSQIDEYLNNFLLNYSVFAKTMHSQIITNKDKEELKIASFQYLSSIISCWETFFRDVFVFLNSIDSYLKKTISKLKLIDSEIIDIEKQVDIHEYLAKSFNFQNIEDIKIAMLPIFNQDVFDKVAKDEFVSYFPKQNREGQFSLERIFPDYKLILVEAIDKRHKMIHDSNLIRNVSYDSRFFQKTETVFLIIPQILSRLLSDKYNLKRFVISNGDKSYNYLFLIDDLISNDWKIVK